MRYVMLGVQIKGEGRGEEMSSNNVLSLGFDDGSFSLLFPKTDGICLMRYRNIKRLSLKRSLVNGIGSMQRRRSETHLCGLRADYIVRAIPIYIL